MQHQGHRDEPAARLLKLDWNVSDTNQPYFDVEFTTSEGTWMSLDVSPDGSSIVFDLLGDLYLLPIAGGDATLIQGGSGMHRLPVFSPDGSKLLYLSDSGGHDNLWISDADGTSARQVTHETSDLLTGPVWGPEGRFVAAAKIYAPYPKLSSSEIRLFDVTGETTAGSGRLLIDVPVSKRDVLEPDFSRDGRHLYYTERLMRPNIYVDANHINHAVKRLDLHTGLVEELASGFGGAITPRISGDGRRLAFVRRVMDRTVLFVMNLETGEQRPIYDRLDRDNAAVFELQGNYHPRFAWFPDDRHIAIWAKGKVFRIDTENGAASEIPFRVTSRHRITEPIRFVNDLAPAEFTVRAIRHLAPSPDGRTLIFTALGHLWRKELPGGRPGRLMRGSAFGFEPTYSEDGEQIAYVEWDDERGSALKVGKADGREPKSVAISPGVIRQPRFSADGTRVVYRIQDPDVSMGGARAKPGIYWVDLDGGESRYVIAGDAAPMFSPDGQRVYYVEIDHSGVSASEVMRSVTLNGLDMREHARTPDVDTSELRISPDLRWLAFRDRQQYHVLRYTETGRPLLVSAATTEALVRRLTDRGGDALTWSADSSALHWCLGPELYRAEVAGCFAPGAGLPLSYGDVGLSVPSDTPEGTIAFIHARVITMRGEEVIEDGTVVVSGNRIAAVGPGKAVAVPEGATVIDLTGKTVMPGLIDAHGHIDCCWCTGTSPQKQPTRYAAMAFGVTTNFDPFPNDLTSYESTETTMAGITVGPRWIGTGIAVHGRPQKSYGMYWPIETFQDARNALARKRALGSIVIKSYKQPSRRQRQMIVKAAREVGVNVHVEGETHFYNNISMILDGHTNLEHNLPVANYYDDLIQLMTLAKAHNTPTLVVCFGELFGENYMYQATEAWKDPRVRTYVQETQSGYSPLGTPYGAPPYVRAMTTIHVADELYDIGFRSVARSIKKLDDAGVVINAGSHGEVPGLAMHWEMALLAQGGMSNHRVLRTATINVATTLGIDAQVGSLEAGKLADLIVLEENPLEDIGNSTSVRNTMVNGRLYDSFSMDEIGNYDRPRTKFYWELQDRNGIDWNEAWGHR